MALPTNIAENDPDHPGIHNAERAGINANEQGVQQALDEAVEARNTALAAAQEVQDRVPNASGIRVVTYGTNVNMSRPPAALVWWKGAAGANDPVNAIMGDVIFIADA